MKSNLKIPLICLKIFNENDINDKKKMYFKYIDMK